MRKQLVILASSLSLLVWSGSQSVQAQSDTPAPPPSTASGGAEASQSGTAAAGTAQSPGSTAANPGDVVPGEAAEARKMLLSRINQAKAEGIGTSAYMAEFGRIEEAARDGDTADKLQTRVMSLARSLKEQIDRSRILKTQRPTPPAGSQMRDGSGGAGGAPGHGPGSGGPPGLAGAPGSGSMLDKLKERFGGDMSGIPDSVKDKFLNSDKGRKILEKLQGQ